jgi:hypothetical protein
MTISEKLSKIYLDKICTILTREVAVPIKNGIQHAQYFTGRVKEIDNFGIHIQSVDTHTMSFFLFPIVGIVEEKFIPNEDPKAQEIKKELIKKNSPTDLISIEDMTEKIKMLKSQTAK